ncbi:TonB-dependent receptor [Flavobacterium sp. LHD-80]|uniref:TonB-dependent receptor n=1 Tax=Flavobacterium sp. LHD-80 TaxID=3071411 RepID=UPI0027DEED83|nr:TonB-dependent receptor [Flavobacterium sp. LHD-80]MDQ6469196.1 TonB-dependent receptor [Flavobacterium sp. LHD-80]
MLNKLFYTTLLWCFLLTSAFAQQNTGSIKGTVLTADDQNAGSVNVVITELKKSAITDENGIFILHKIPAGTYQIEINMMGHTPAKQQVTVTANETANITFQLESSLKELQEVVVVSGAKKFAEKKSEYVARLPISNLENPQVYTVVPKELFQEQIATDFRSALTTAPGLSNVTQSVGSGGVGLSIRMRGFSGASAAGSIRNGMNTNYVTMSDPVNLESIEVIKGPSATLFGSTLTTYGGLVNRVTKKPFEITKGEVSYTTGSWALSRTTIDFNTPLNEEKTMLFRINAALDNQKTWQDFGKSKTFIIAPSFTYIANDKLTFDFDVEMYSGSRNASYTGLGNFNPANSNYKSFNDLNFDFKKSNSSDDLQSEAKNTNVYARATYKLSEKWVSQTNFSNAYTDNKANYLFLLMNNNPTAGALPLLQRRLMTINSTFKTSQLQQNFVGNFKIGSLKNRLLVGLDYVYLGTNDTRWMINSYDAAAGNPLTPINGDAPTINMEKYKKMLADLPEPWLVNNRDLRTTSAYVSDVINFTDNLLAMASVRYDHNEDRITKQNQNFFSPKMGVVYQIVKDKVSVFGNYMNGFTNTGAGEVPGGAIVEFKPEQANQLEGGVKVEILGGKLNGTLSYYDIKVKDKVRYDNGFQIQDGTQSSKGFEADLIANPFRGFHVIMGYGYNESKYTSGAANGKTPYGAPANVANLWMSYKILDGKVKGLGFGFGGNTQSDSFANDANTFTVNGYTVMDATVFYEKSKFRLGLKLNNIANKEYWTNDYWSTMMPTRQLVANITLKF